MNSKKGFTLIEVVVVIAIVAIFVAMVVPLVKKVATAEKVTETVAPEPYPVYDDKEGGVYIHINDPYAKRANEATVDLMKVMANWRKENPSKKITAMTMVNGASQGTGSSTYLMGLLLYYEER